MRLLGCVSVCVVQSQLDTPVELCPAWFVRLQCFLCDAEARSSFPCASTLRRREDSREIVSRLSWQKDVTCRRIRRFTKTRVQTRSGKTRLGNVSVAGWGGWQQKCRVSNMAFASCRSCFASWEFPDDSAYICYTAIPPFRQPSVYGG